MTVTIITIIINHFTFSSSSTLNSYGVLGIMCLWKGTEQSPILKEFIALWENMKLVWIDK